MRKLLSFFILLVATLQVSASGSLAKQDSTSRKKKKYGLYFSFDIRKSLVREIPVRMSGLKIGITFHKKHSIGIGYYNLGRPIFNDYYISDPAEYDASQTLFSKKQGKKIDVETTVKLSLAYASFFYEYRFLARRKWNMDFNTQFGAGIVNIEVINKTNGRLIGAPKKDLVKLLEASVIVQYKIFSWLGLGAGMGYRYMINPNEYISTTFNYPIWTVRLVLFPAKLRPVFKGEKKWYK